MKYILKIFILICICSTGSANLEQQIKNTKIGNINFDEFIKLSKEEQKKQEDHIYKNIKIKRTKKTINPLKKFKLIVHKPSGEYTTVIPSYILFEPKTPGKGNLQIVRQSSFKLKKLIDRKKFFKKYKKDFNLVYIDKPIKIEKDSKLFNTLNNLGKFVIYKKDPKIIKS